MSAEKCPQVVIQAQQEKSRFFSPLSSKSICLRIDHLQNLLLLKFTYLNKARQESIDIAISTQIFRIQWKTIVDHCNNQPREKDVEGTFSHFWSFDQDKNLFKNRQEFLASGQFNFNFFFLLCILILKKNKLVGII